MKVNEFLNILENNLLNKDTKYRLGTFFNKRDGSKYLCDCSGLIKACFWGYPSNGTYQKNLKDIDADTMIKQCIHVSSDFSNIKPGELVWMKGHIGVYLRDGVVIECTQKWNNGVQLTYLNNGINQNIYGLHERKWNKHGKFKYIDYSTSNNNVNNSSRVDINKVVDDVIDGKYGNGHDNRKKAIERLGLNYDEVRKLVNQKLKG